MNDEIQKCAACGSNRVVAGRLTAEEYGSSEFNSPCFNFSELKEENKTFYISSPRRGVLIRQRGNATVCLDCGNVSASLALDVKEAMQVLEKCGTDAAKARLSINPPTL